MASDILPVAVIGVGGIGRQTLQALKEIKLVKVVGVADRDPSIAEQAGKEASVAAFTDNRSLLAEARPKAVYAAIPPASCPELISACAQRGIHVWTELPLARDLAEGLMLVQRMEKAGLKLGVGTQRRFAGGYRKAWEIRRQLGPVFLARAHYLFNWGPDLGWRGDKASSGGGALMDLGYHAVDLLVWFLGLPEEVYGFIAGGHRPKAPDETAPLPVYDTDDTAAAIVRYRDGAMASIVTTRSSGPVSEELSLHGQEGSLTANSETCLLRDPDGNVLETSESESPPVTVFSRQARTFARAVLEDSKRYECSGRENLLNLAVIEAIYLADRTSQPESPARLLQSHGLSEEDCLRCRPVSVVAV